MFGESRTVRRVNNVNAGNHNMCALSGSWIVPTHL